MYVGGRWRGRGKEREAQIATRDTETDRRSRRVKRRDTAQSASGDPGRTWRKLGPLRRALECRPGRNLEKIGRTRDEIASQTRVGRRQRNKGRGTHNGAGWRCRGKRRRETGWAHARTRSSSKRAVCTLWSGGSRRESHLTMMIVCRDDRSATIVRDKNSMSITITRYRYQLQLQSMIIVHQRRLGGARQGRIIELSRRWMIDDQN